jgi:glycosyltransferase involved in cell wall biosynthesis
VYDPVGMFGGGEARAVRVRPVVVAPAQDEGRVAASAGEREAVWHGVFRGYSGYAKMNREIVLRAANTLRISAVHAIDPPDHDDYGLRRVELHRRVAVSPHAPLVRCFGPWGEKDDRYRVIYTMMETEFVHPTMVGIMNDNYHECWTPTRWNADAFQRSGLKVPVRVMPLGVNPHVYRPGPRGTLPPCKLLTTPRAGETEVPQGFVFVYCFLPSFRKGLDVLIPAFEDAFGGDPRAALVLAVTHRPSWLTDPDLDEPRREFRSRVYMLTGGYTEREMARLYRSCDCYVTASRGEGWNLPMCEAAACGLPVVAPRNTAHAELLDDATGFLFDTEGNAPWASGQSVSPWYENMAFSVLGERSRAHLAEQMRRVMAGGPEVSERAARFTDLVRSRYTWDRAAARVVERLLEITA